MIRSIEEIDLGGKKTFIRVDFNVPLDDDGNVADDTRIRAALPTIKHALENKAKVILASHLGRPKGKRVESMSLMPVAETLRDLIARDVIFADDCIGDGVKKLAFDLKKGEILLLENLRFHKGERENDPRFAQQLAALCEVYVNDAFGTAHRAHASTEGVPRLKEEVAAGFLMKKEVEMLGKLLENPKRPFVVILGGAKVSDKIGVILNLLDKADVILVGGGMAYPFLKLKGKQVGNSMVEKGTRAGAMKILEKVERKNIPLLLPTDHIIALSMEMQSGDPVKEIPETHMALDIGPETVETFSSRIEKAGTIFWNGPMGVFENPAFADGTTAIARAINQSSAFSVVGGGDSVAALHKCGCADNISHISTGGGASLKLMEGKELPGVAALDKPEPTEEPVETEKPDETEENGEPEKYGDFDDLD